MDGEGCPRLPMWACVASKSPPPCNTAPNHPPAGADHLEIIQVLGNELRLKQPSRVAGRRCADPARQLPTLPMHVPSRTALNLSGMRAWHHKSECLLGQLWKSGTAWVVLVMRWCTAGALRTVADLSCTQATACLTATSAPVVQGPMKGRSIS